MPVFLTIEVMRECVPCPSALKMKVIANCTTGTRMGRTRERVQSLEPDPSKHGDEVCGKGRCISVSSRPAGLQSKVQDNQGYAEKSCLKKRKTKQRNKHSYKRGRENFMHTVGITQKHLDARV